MITRPHRRGRRDFLWIPIGGAVITLGVVIALQVSGVEVSPAILVGFGAAIGANLRGGSDSEARAPRSVSAVRRVKIVEIISTAWMMLLLLGVGLTLPPVFDLLRSSGSVDRSALIWGLVLLSLAVVGAGGAVAAVLVSRHRRVRRSDAGRSELPSPDDRQP